MPSKMNRKFKFRSQMLFVILPLLLVPLLLIFIVRVGLFNYIKKQKIESNSAILYQISLAVNEKLKDPDFRISQIESMEELNSSSFFQEGLFYIYDEKNKQIYSNTSQRLVKNEYDIEESALTGDDKVKSIMLNHYDKEKDIKLNINKCVSFDLKISNITFFSVFLDTANFNYMDSRIKLLYFYPKNILVSPITGIILLLIIVSFIIFILIMFIVIKMSDDLVFPLNELDYLTKKVGQGHLNFDVITYSKDEIGRLFNSSKDLISNYQKVLRNILNSSNNLVGYKKTMENSIDDFNSSLSNQLNSISGNTNIFNKFNEFITKTLNGIKVAQGLIEQAQIQSDNSGNIINQMISEIANIAETTQQISSIVELINGISEKTRLLSVNSAIEASRAGEAGKGFGVVASEIRKLALQAKNAASQIGELIKLNDRKVVSGVNKSHEAIEVLRNIDSSIKLINDKMSQINKSAQEEKNLAKEIFDINNYFSSSSNKNINSIGSLSKLKSLFSNEVEKIRSEIGKFNFDIHNKEVIRDYKLKSTNDKKLVREEKTDSLKVKDNMPQIEYKGKSKKVKERKNNKLDTIKALTLYKPKKGLFGIFNR